MKKLPMRLNWREHQTEFEFLWASKRHWVVQPDGGAPNQPITLDLTLQSTRETKAQITIYTNGTLTGKLAKAVKANTDSPSRFTAFATTKALFRRTTTDPPPNREPNSHEVGKLPLMARLQRHLKPGRTVLLTRLRSGKNHVLDPVADLMCPLCMKSTSTEEN